MTQDEIEKAVDAAYENDAFAISCASRKGLYSRGFLAGAEHAKKEERFRIVQILANLPEVSIENITWGEIARLIEAPEAESK